MGYKRLQGVTRGYKGLQGFTGGDKGLERSQIPFLGLFCIKIKVEEISIFLPKRWTNPFGKILILLFSYTVVFIVFKGFFFYLERQQTLFLDLFLINTKDEKTSTF